MLAKVSLLREEQPWNDRNRKNKNLSLGKKKCELALSTSQATFRARLDSTARPVTYTDAGKDSALMKSLMPNPLEASVNSQSLRNISTNEFLVK